MKRILVLLITISLFAACSSTKSTEGKKKIFNGKIIYSMSYSGDITPAQIAQQPKTTEISSMEGRLKRDVVMDQGTQSMIVNDEIKVTYMLLDFGEMMGRYVIRTPFDSIPKDTSTAPKWKEDVMVTEETKSIAEYVCKKAVVTETKEGEDDRMYNVFFCPELGEWPEIKIHEDDVEETSDMNGVPLEFVEYRGDVKVTYTAISVKKGGMKDYDFLKPTDFKEVTGEELQKIFGGGQ